MIIKRLFALVSLLFVLVFAAGNPVLADTTHDGDIVLTGDEVLVIEDTTYTQTGEIFIRDNARLVIRNSTLLFNVSYHGQFEIWVEDKGTIEVINSKIQSGLNPNEGAGINALGEATVVIDNTDLSNRIAVSFIVYDPETAYKGTATISNSQIHYFDIPFTVYGQPTISLLNTSINQCVFRCNNYQGEFSDLKPGLFDHWTYNQNSYSITLDNTSINLLTLQCESPSEITVRNSEFFTLGCGAQSDISLHVFDSTIGCFPFHGFDNNCSGHLSDLRPGLYSQWNLHDYATDTSINMPDVRLCPSRNALFSAMKTTTRHVKTTIRCDRDEL